MSKEYYYGDKYDEICTKLGMRNAAYFQEMIVKPLEAEGYSEKGICFALNRGLDKVAPFVGDSRFASIAINQVRKVAFKKNDIRWNKN